MKRLVEVLFLTILSLPALASASVVRVRPYVRVSPGTEVHLSQVIETQGVSSEFLKAAKHLSLSVAPVEGAQQELTSMALSAALRPLISSERDRTGQLVQLSIPKTLTLDTATGELDATNLEPELVQVWQPLCEDCLLEMEALSPPKVTGVKDFKLKMKSDLPKGSFSVPIELTKENGQKLTAWVSGQLRIKRKVPVSQRMLARQERIGAQDIAWEYRDVSNSLDNPPTAEELVGKLAKMDIRANEVLWRNQIEKEKAVRRGEVVQLKSSSGSWEVSTMAVAQQDGYIGDSIQLKNVKTSAVLVGQVTAFGEVELK